MSGLKSYLNTTSGDSFLLIFVRMITLLFGIFMTKILSEHFSVYDYGTYSQVILLVSTISNLTTLGMIDGLNFFFCRESDSEKKESYVSTIFFLQYLISAIVSIITILCASPIVGYFKNEDLKPLVIFVALLPVLNNSIAMLQVLFVAIGKAKVIALRNLIVSVLKLGAIIIACYVFDNIAFLLFFQVILDFLQVVYFAKILSRNHFKIRFLKFNRSLMKEILFYCIPMAMSTIIKTLNRDCDKFVISYFTDTETCAIYLNASRLLPFDIIMASFCTVLLPYLTRYIAEKKFDATLSLYRSFLEISYISTMVLAVGAICVSPELMTFLYSEKYLSGLYVFIIYIIVDILSVLTITLLLSASGKTKSIMYVAVGSFLLNLFFNIGSFYLMGPIGPALSTVLVTFIQGLVLLKLGANEIHVGLLDLFDMRYLCKFSIQLLIALIIFSEFRKILHMFDLNYFVIMVIIYLLFIIPLCLLNYKRFINNLKVVNNSKN